MVAAARARLARTTDPELIAPWTLKNGDQEFFTMPRICGDPQLRDESFDSSSRTAQRLPATERRADPADLRTDGG